MIADALKSDVERYAAEMDRKNGLYVGALTGQLTPARVSYYLHNVKHLIGRTQTHLARARERSIELGELSLAEFYATKQVEEHGHDRWAESDLGRVRDAFGVHADENVSPGLLGLLRFLEDTIERDPMAYLAYAFFAEYLVVLLGPAWLELLEERCGVPASMMSVISKHADLDREHTSENMAVIDALVRDPAKLGELREVLRQSIEHFDRFSADVLGFDGRLSEGSSCSSASIA